MKKSQSKCNQFALFVLMLTLSTCGPSLAQSDAAGGALPGASGTYNDLGYGSYPRVTEIEQQLLGKTYEKDSLTTRVARLETKQFGKSSPSDDLADRLDRLDLCLEKKQLAADDGNGQTAAPLQAGNSAAVQSQTNSDSPNSSPRVGQDAGANTKNGSANATQYTASDYGSYPRVTELEQQFLGSTFVKDPLPVRVARLETKEFGKTTPNDDLCDRIDRLDKLAGPKQNSQMAANDPSEDGSSTNTSTNRSGKGSIGRSLLGMLGGIMGNGGMLGNGMGMMGMPPGAFMPGLQDDMRDSARAKRQGADSTSDSSSNSSSNSPPPNPFATGALPVSGNENRIAVIERFVLGREHGELPLAERVQHVEKKLVPYEHHQVEQDLTKRVDHLWSILSAANKTTNKSVAAASGTTQQ